MNKILRFGLNLQKQRNEQKLEHKHYQFILFLVEGDCRLPSFKQEETSDRTKGRFSSPVARCLFKRELASV